MSFLKGICGFFCLCLTLLTLTGCSRHFFTAAGQVGTEGPAFGTWAFTPQGCSRDPIDGLTDQRTATVASFFWQDPGTYDIAYRDNNRASAPDLPEQLNLIHGPASTYQVRLKTIKTTGWLIHPSECARLQVDIHEQPAAFPGGRPSLAGTVHLSCTVKQSHVWADLTFERCDY